MVMTYTGTDGLFTALGKLIKEVNDYLTLAGTTLPADLDNIGDVFEASNAGNRRETMATLSAKVEQWKSVVAPGWTGELHLLVAQRLQDYDTVLAELDIEGGDVQAVLFRLIDQMVIDSADVDASAVTLGSVTAASGNVGNGTVLTDKELDAVSRPDGINGRMAAHPRYNGVDSELALTDTMTLRCVADSQTSGVGVSRTTEAQERFEWYGSPREQQRFSWQTEGAGKGPTVTALNASPEVQNRDFELWSSNVPIAWDLDNGTAGTHVLQETTAADVYRGDAALKFAGDGSQATIQISQKVAPSKLTARKKYLLALRYKASATIAAGTFGVEFNGDGYTPASSEKIEIAAGSLATSWTLSHFWITLPDTIPDDWELVVKWTGTPTNAKNLWVDSLAFGPAEWFNGHACGVIAGATPFKSGDRFTYSTTNDGAGLIQEYFRRGFGVQLPSDTGGTETIADTVVS